MPILSVFAAAADVSDREYAAALVPGDQFRIEEWVERDAVSAVSVQKRRIRAI